MRSICDKPIVPPLPSRSDIFDHVKTFITYQCYTITLDKDGTVSDQDIQDGLLITINHKSLPINYYNIAVESLNVVVGLSNQTTVGVDVLISKSASISVLPGSNLAAAISMNIREVFVHPGVAAFGLYQVFFCLLLLRLRDIELHLVIESPLDSHYYKHLPRPHSRSYSRSRSVYSASFSSKSRPNRTDNLVRREDQHCFGRVFWSWWSMDLIGWLVCDYIRRNLVTLSIW